MNLRVILFTLFLFLTGQSYSQEQQATIVFTGEMPLINNQSSGDYPELGGLLEKIRNKPTPTFFFFGGGSLGPSPMSAFDRGSHIIDILNTLEPDAMSVTKREFSYFEEELSLRSYEAAFPIIASNIYEPRTGTILDGLNDHLIIEKAGVKLGVISMLDKTVVKEYLLTRVDIAEPKQSIITKARQLKESGADFIVLMYSVNFPFIDELLEQGVLDLSLVTDPHYSLSTSDQIPEHPNSIYMTESGIVAEVELTWDKDKKDKLTINWQKHYLREQQSDPTVQMQVSGYSKRLDRLLDEQVGVLATPMDTRREVVRAEESAFANFVADSLKEFFDTDIAFINGGVIRGEQQYEANTILTRRHIATELPFRSRIVVIEATGKMLKDAMENALSMIEENKGRFLHLSGASVVFDSKAKPGQRLREFKVAGADVKDSKLYKIATSDYLASGGDDFIMLKNAKAIELNTRISPLLSEVVINQIRQKRQISPILEGRLVDVAKEKL